MKDQATLTRRVQASFEGRVQGVGFRFTTVEIARGHEVYGYVQNGIDGSVKLVAEGSDENLHRFLDSLRASHIYRYVTREDVAWKDATGEYDSFSIHYS